MQEDEERAILENVEENIVSIKLLPIDKNKKYKIALLMINEPEMNKQYKINMRIN